jgi:isoaspartyl peptidase/L-asparaginase-like protein (Ntn-hydrolase superfamily)
MRALGLRPVVPLVTVVLALGACKRPAQNSAPTAEPLPTCVDPAPATIPPTPWKAAAIAHAGVGSPSEQSDGCRAAVDAALKAIERGADPVDAVVEGIEVLEDDVRFNAGTGSAVRLDGESVQMDASVMRSDGRFGAVAGIENVKNPVAVARRVMDTPHLLLQGDGATRFARTLGMPVYDPTTKDRVDQANRIRQKLIAHDPSIDDAWEGFDWRARWNYATPLADLLQGAAADGDAQAAVDAGSAANDASTSPLDAGHDTVGVAVRTSDGRYAVALSTGGYALALRGRVGDVPILGAGLYAGAYGASAATGTGERIVEAALSREVQGWLKIGLTPADAAQRAVEQLRSRGDIGIIVIGPTSMAARADREMAWAARESGSNLWEGGDVK